jgi:hypothetical protein
MAGRISVVAGIFGAGAQAARMKTINIQANFLEPVGYRKVIRMIVPKG